MGLTVKVKRRKLYLTGLPDALAKEQMRHAKKAVELYETSVEESQEKAEFDVEPLHWDGLKLNIYARGSFRQRYMWIDGGFLRKVRMEDDFMAKSTPGILRQGSGRGGLMTSAKGFPVMLNTPTPVEPRRFTKSVADAIRNDYFEGMRKVLRRYLKNRG